MKIKKAKGTKKCVIKTENNFQDYENCLEAAQIERKIKYLKKKKFKVDNLNKHQKEFLKSNKLKSKKLSKNERYNVFTKVTNKIALIQIITKECDQLIL